jgi:hypothetical protein
LVHWNQEGTPGTPGPDGADGAAGADGTYGADGTDGADGVSGLERVTHIFVITDDPLVVGDTFNVKVFCPAPKKALGGGGATPHPENLVMSTSLSTAASDGWSVEFTAIKGRFGSERGVGVLVRNGVLPI